MMCFRASYQPSTHADSLNGPAVLTNPSIPSAAEINV